MVSQVSGDKKWKRLEVKVPFVVKVKKELKDERLGIPSMWTDTA